MADLSSPATFARVDAEAPWRPGAELLADSRLAHLLRKTRLPSLEELQARAVTDPGWFWGVAIDDLGLDWQRRPTATLDLAEGVPFARWWVGGAFDHALASVEPWRRSRPDEEAVAWEGEDGEVRRLTGTELADAAEAAADRFAAHGIGEGTRVGVLLPMLIETVVTVLALGRLRAVFTPIFSGYAAPAVATRLRAFEATHLVTADGFRRRGGVIQLKEIADAAVADSPTVARVLVVRRLGTSGLGASGLGASGLGASGLGASGLGGYEAGGYEPGREGSAATRPGGSDPGDELGGAATRMDGTHEAWDPVRDAAWDPVRDAAWDADPTPAQRAALPPRRRPSGPTDPETPYMVIYTSGTTGVPKGTVHVHGGFPVKAAQDLAHTFDLRPGDALCWITDLGWMMGPWALSGAMLLGARLVLYEGAPDWPDPGRVWSLAARHRLTHLGISPTLVRALLVHGADPVLAHDRSTLRVLGSTGEPWNPEPWHWLFETVGGGRLPIVNYSGGTEVSGGIVGCNVLRPIRATSFNGPCLGMAADVVDEAGRSIEGEVGELVVRAPWPGMTRGFWGGTAEARERYLDTYWRRMPGTWVHGDWAVRDRDGFWYLHGRSDDTLKVAGKRLGPAEVETAAVAHPAVVEAAAIGVPDELKGEVVVVLCVLRRDATTALADQVTLAREVSELVVRDLGKPCRPAAVAVVPELPRTRSGKIMRRVARAAWLGLDPGDLSALENPAAVTAIAARGPAAGRA